MKKSLSLLLGLIMICSVFLCSCDEDDKGNDPTGTQAPSAYVDSKYDIEDNLPEGNLDTTFRIIGEGGTGWNAGEIMFPESDSADTLASALYMRYKNVEDRFGVKIETTLSDSIYTAVSGSIKAGDRDFDMIFMSTANTFKAAIDGYLLNLYDVPYVELSQPYYDQNYIKDMSIGDNIYSAVTDMMTIDTHCMWIMAYNRDLINKYDLENPYELVKNNEWTLDKFTQMLDIAVQDNGDGIWDAADKYGLTTHLGAARNFFYASGMKICEKTDDGTNVPYLAIENNVKLLTVMEKAKAILYDNNRTLMGTDGNARLANFTAGNTLFFAEIAGYLGAFRDMESDYGVVPYPKYDKNQSKYYTSNDPCIMVMSVPDFNLEEDSKELTNSGIITEALCAASYRIVRPAYYEKILGGKNTRHEEDFEMLNLCKDSRVYDFGLFNRLGSISDIYTTLLADKNSSYSSAVARKLPAAQRSLNDLIEQYEKDSQN